MHQSIHERHYRQSQFAGWLLTTLWLVGVFVVHLAARALSSWGGG